MSMAHHSPAAHPLRKEVSLRPFRPDDLEVLYRIDQACFPPGISYSRRELAAFITHRNSKTWVATTEDETVGFLVANRAPQQVGHIVTIDVVRHWRRRAIGTALMDAAEDWARAESLRLVYLETAEDNAAAQAFYEKRGYVKVKRILHYYANGTAAWVMVKRLDQSTVDSRQPSVDT